MDNNVFKAILAMDAYNRGYNAGIKFGSLAGDSSVDTPGTEIGNATIYRANGDPTAQLYGFYGIAYQLDGGETIVSYRGTDNISQDA